MALTDDLLPYELLIRFGLDGAPQGAHVQRRRRVVLDGEVLKDEPQPPEPIDLAGFPTSGLMAHATRDALARVVALTAEAQALRAANAALTTANAALAAANTALAAANAQLQAQVDAHGAADAAPDHATAAPEG